MVNWFDSLLIAICVLMGLALVGLVIWFMYDTGISNGEKVVELQQQCISAGGTYIQRVGCLMDMHLQFPEGNGEI